MSRRGLRKPSSAVAGLICFCVISPALAEGVKISTIVPSEQYDTLGVVTASQMVPAQVFFSSKDPFKEALSQLTPLLEAQAKARGANMVVVTSITTHLGSDSMYLLVFGTAVRVGSSPRTSTGGAEPPEAAPSGNPLKSRGLWLVDHGPQQMRTAGVAMPLTGTFRCPRTCDAVDCV